MRGSLLVFALLLLAGCVTPPDQMWVEQRKGIQAIPNPDTRLNALANVAESAAYAGDASAVKMLLKDLENDPRHDQVADRCATQIANKTPADGVRIAKLIKDPGKQKEALTRLESKQE